MLCLNLSGGQAVLSVWYGVRWISDSGSEEPRPVHLCYEVSSSGVADLPPLCPGWPVSNNMRCILLTDLNFISSRRPLQYSLPHCPVNCIWMMWRCKVKENNDPSALYVGAARMSRTVIHAGFCLYSGLAWTVCVQLHTSCGVVEGRVVWLDPLKNEAVWWCVLVTLWSSYSNAFLLFEEIQWRNMTFSYSDRWRVPPDGTIRQFIGQMSCKSYTGCVQIFYSVLCKWKLYFIRGDFRMRQTLSTDHELFGSVS